MRLSDFHLKTDKGYAHNTLLIYERLLSGRNVGSIMEIGVLNGDSIRMWSEVYPEARVLGIDTEDVSSLSRELANVEIFCDNAYIQRFLDRLRIYSDNHKLRWDLILDDGSHVLRDQCYVAENYPAFLSKDGMLVIEDIASIENAHVIQSFIPEEIRGSSYIIDRRGAPCGYNYQRFDERNEILLVLDKTIR